MKYGSKDDAIQAAAKRGSSATTFKGAAKYLLQHPVRHHSVRAEGWRLTRGTRKDYELTRRGERCMKRFGLLSRPEAEAWAVSLTAPLTCQAESALYAAWPYKASRSTWAGGVNHISVQIGAIPEIKSFSTREWSKNGKWSGSDSHQSLTVTPTTLGMFPTLMTPDGLVLIDAQLIGPREYRITWLEQSRGIELRAVEGFLIRGYHIQAANLEQARKKVLKVRAAALSVAVMARLKKREDREWKAGLQYIWVGKDDSIKAGNCPVGTERYREQLSVELGNEIGGIRADELLRHRDDAYTRRAINAAIARQ